MPGVIYLVATPIGNLEDMTFRAVRILNEVDLIAAEDTRQTLKLLNHFEIRKPLVSYHEHNKRESGEKLIKEVLEGKSIAIVTDAGTPGISDPGEDIVRLAVENGIEVFSIPGAAAFVYALVVSGLPTSRFIFDAFLPRDNKPKRERLLELKDEERTLIFYEAPHRLRRTLDDIYEVLGDRKVSIGRELTKKHEEILRCSLKEAIEIYGEKEPRGEYVIVIEGRSREEIEREKQAEFEEVGIEEHIIMYIEKGLNKKDAIKQVAKDRNMQKSEVYKYSLNI